MRYLITLLAGLLLLLKVSAFGMTPNYDRQERLIENETPLVNLHNCDYVGDLMYSYLYRISRYNKTMLETFVAENDKCDPFVTSYTSDYGLCQLNIRWHGDFIRSEWYQNPLGQIDYCVGLREYEVDHLGKMPRYGYRVRARKSRQITYLDFSNVKLYLGI